MLPESILRSDSFVSPFKLISLVTFNGVDVYWLSSCVVLPLAPINALEISPDITIFLEEVAWNLPSALIVALIP